MNNFIEVHYLNGVDVYQVPRITQYDRGWQIKFYNLPSDAIIEVQYAIEGMYKTLNNLPELVDGIWISKVPNTLTAQNKTIKAYVYITSDVFGQTKAEINIPIDPRPEPGNFEFTEAEETEFSQMMKEIQAAIDSANTITSKIDNMTVSAIDLSNGSVPTVKIADLGDKKHITFGLVQGKQGIPGTSGYQAFEIADDGCLYYERSEDVNVDFELNEKGELIIYGN